MKSILLVEDEFVIAFNIRNYLTKLGYAVTTGITQGPEVTETIKRDHYDLVLMNVRLQNDIDGIEVISQIRSFSSVPVIYLTSLTDPKTRRRAEKTKPAGFIKKPFEFEDLGHAIEKCWKSPQQS